MTVSSYRLDLRIGPKVCAQAAPGAKPDASRLAPPRTRLLRMNSLRSWRCMAKSPCRLVVACLEFMECGRGYRCTRKPCPKFSLTSDLAGMVALFLIGRKVRWRSVVRDTSSSVRALLKRAGYAFG